MKKQFLILLLIFSFIFSPLISLASIDDSHIRSIVQILIYDNLKQQFISTGSGVSIGGTAILTNYHVAEDIIKKPNDYSAIICFTKNSQSEPACDYMAHAYYRFGQFKAQAEYEKSLDLAVIYINYKKNVSGVWESIFNLPISEYAFDEINPALYGYEMTDIKLGDQIQTLGFPDYGNDTITYSNGVISNFIMDDGSTFNDHNGVLMIGTNALISHGSSGGAAFDKNGKFLGITSSGIEDNNGNLLIGLIIPVTTFNWWREKVLGNKISDWFGYTHGNIPEETGKEVMCLLQGKSYNKTLNECACGKGTKENTNEECVAMSKDEMHNYCKATFGEHSFRSYLQDYPETSISSDVCICEQPDYILNAERSRCILRNQPKNIAPEENKPTITINSNLQNRLKGYILLQVESHGEAWYVNPVDGKRYYMKDGATAYEMMRKFGLGITNDNLGKLPKENESNNYPSLVNNLRGKILLQVESLGEAWYINPKTGFRHYMKDGEAAYSLMRFYSLGITNTDLNKIPVGSI